jgi:hypothetical protein
VPAAYVVAKTLGWTLLGYLALLLFSFLVWKSQATAGIDSRAGDHSLFGTAIREVVYSLPKLSVPTDKPLLIIAGSSIARAFRPDIIAEAMPGFSVDNLAIVASNLTVLRQLVEDVSLVRPRASMERTTFVIVTSFGMLIDNKHQWDGSAYTGYEQEKLRNHLWEGPPGHLTPTVDTAMLPWAIDALRPAFMFYLLELRCHIAATHSAVKLFRLSGRLPSEGNEKRSIQWAELAQMLPETRDQSTGGSEQFNEMIALLADIRRAGASVVIVKAPVLQWLRERSSTFKWFDQQLNSLASTSNLAVIDLTETAPDREFVDALHATAAAEALWTGRLITGLKASGPHLEKPDLEKPDAAKRD